MMKNMKKINTWWWRKWKWRWRDNGNKWAWRKWKWKWQNEANDHDESSWLRERHPVALESNINHKTNPENQTIKGGQFACSPLTSKKNPSNSSKESSFILEKKGSPMRPILTPKKLQWELETNPSKNVSKAIWKSSSVSFFPSHWVATRDQLGVGVSAAFSSKLESSERRRSKSWSVLENHLAGWTTDLSAKKRMEVWFINILRFALETL